MKTRIVTALMGLVVTAGCATPAAVNELADKTSANVGVVAVRLRQLSEESNRLFAARSDNVSRLQGVNAAQRANLAYDQALTAKSGESDDLKLETDLQAWVKEVKDILDAAAGAEKAQRDALLAGQARLDAKTPELQKVAESLAALAKEESVAERARMLQKFATEVRDDVKKELDDGSANAARAKALLDHVRGATAPASPQ